MRRILILVHEDGALGSQYFLHEIAAVWIREYKHQVVIQRGPAQAGLTHSADVAILHVDLTVVPGKYIDHLRQYPVAINAGVADISKRTISSSLVTPGDGYGGPVIVKTNNNHGGLRETMLSLERGSDWQRRLQRLRQAMSWRMRGESPIDYDIYPSPQDVPQAIWENTDWVVERLRCERQGQWYCLRTWVFLGDRQTHSLSFSTEPVVKAANIVRREPLGEVPEELRRIRSRMGFDFGKFDYAVVDGQVVLFDTNRTPTLGDFPRKQFMPRIRLLAEGLESLLGTGRKEGVAPKV